MLFSAVSGVAYWNQVEVLIQLQSAKDQPVAVSSSAASKAVEPALVTVHPPRKQQAVVLLLCSSLAFLLALRLKPESTAMHDANTFWIGFLFTFALGYRLLAGVWLLGVGPFTSAGKRRFQLFQVLGYALLAVFPAMITPIPLGLCDAADLDCSSRFLRLGRWTQAIAAACMLISIEVFQRRVRVKPRYNRPGLGQWIQAVMVSVLPMVVAMNHLLPLVMYDGDEVGKEVDRESLRHIVAVGMICVVPFSVVTAAVVVGIRRAVSTFGVVGAEGPVSAACCLTGWMCYAMGVMLVVRMKEMNPDLIRVVLAFGTTAWVCFAVSTLLAFSKGRPVALREAGGSGKGEETKGWPMMMTMLFIALMACAWVVESKAMTEVSYEGKMTRSKRRQMIAPVLGGLTLASLALSLFAYPKRSTRLGMLYSVPASLLVSSSALLTSVNLACSVPQQHLPQEILPVCEKIQTGYSLTAAAGLALVFYILKRATTFFPVREHKDGKAALDVVDGEGKTPTSEIKLVKTMKTKPSDSVHVNELVEPGEEPSPLLSSSSDDDVDDDDEVTVKAEQTNDAQPEARQSEAVSVRFGEQLTMPSPFMLPTLTRNISVDSRRSSSSGLEQPLNESPRPETFHARDDDVVVDTHDSEMSEVSEAPSDSGNIPATPVANLTNSVITDFPEAVEASLPIANSSIPAVSQVLDEVVSRVEEASTTIAGAGQGVGEDVEKGRPSSPLANGSSEGKHLTETFSTNDKHALLEITQGPDGSNTDSISTPLVERELPSRASRGVRTGMDVTNSPAGEEGETGSIISKNSTCSCSYCCDRGSDTDESALASVDAEDSLRPLSISQTDDCGLSPPSSPRQGHKQSAKPKSNRKKKRTYSEESLTSLISSNASDSSYSSSDTQGLGKEYPLRSKQRPAKSKPVPPALPPRRYMSGH